MIMMEKPKSMLCFDNYPEAKMALGNVIFPAIIKPYGCNDKRYMFKVMDYAKAVQVLFDAFEHTSNGWIVIESI